MRLLSKPLLFSLAAALLVSGCATQKLRTISGRLVQPKTRTPIAGQKLDLDRPPGNGLTVPNPFASGPQPVPIASAFTDPNGQFQFATKKDLGRPLTIRLSGTVPSDFRSRSGTPASNTEFDPNLVHKPGGGFMYVP
jgi:hypothetical protein